MGKILNFLQNSLESATLVPNKTRLKPSVPSFARSLLSLTIISVMGLKASSLSLALEKTEVNGYIRATYQSHDVKDDKTYKDDALGGKIHFETGAFKTLSLGASAYASRAIFNDDNHGLVPLRGESHKSYALLGEAYLKSEFGKSMLKVGCQEIETPFAQVDDIGMVPNTFEAAIFENHDIADTTLFLGQIQRMAGVDAEVVDKFTKINGSNHMQVVGLSYEGVKDWTLSGWYYRLKKAEIESIGFLEADYEKVLDDTTFALGFQYGVQDYREQEDTKVYGAMMSATDNRSRLTLGTAYTKVGGNAVSSGFGGGPFYSNSEYLILDNAGREGKALWYGGEYDASHMGYKGLTVGLGKVTLTNEFNQEATETDLVLSYELDDAFEIHAIASALNGANVGEDEAKHLRIFANYNF